MAAQTQKDVSFPTIVNLNVGGQIHTTSLSTLTKYSDSMLGAMFSGRFPVQRDPSGNYFIDRDGALFRYVLEFLRNGELQATVNSRESRLLLKEAEFFQISALTQTVKQQMKILDRNKGHTQDETEIITIFGGDRNRGIYVTSVSGRLRTLKEMFHICDGKDDDQRFQIAPYGDQTDRSEINKTGIMTPTSNIVPNWIVTVAELHGFNCTQKQGAAYCWLLSRTVPQPLSA